MIEKELNYSYHFSRPTDKGKRVFAFTGLLSKQKEIFRSKCILIYSLEAAQ
jgi:hypothetical protein